MNAVERAQQVCEALSSAGYPYLGAELLLEIDSRAEFPLVQVWDDACQSLILIAFVDRNRHLAAALDYARRVADESGYGDWTLCYAICSSIAISESGNVVFKIAWRDE